MGGEVINLVKVLHPLNPSLMMTMPRFNDEGAGLTRRA